MTLRTPAAEPLPLRGDHGQGVAGLGDLRLPAARLAAASRSCSPTGTWAGASRDAFVAEFCALGGRVDEPARPLEVFDPRAPTSPSVPRDVDGVAVFVAVVLRPGGLPRSGSRGASRDPARHIVLGPADRRRPDAAAGRRARALAGVVGSSYRRPGADARSYLRRLRGGPSRARPPTSPAASSVQRLPRRGRGAAARARAPAGARDRLPAALAQRARRPARRAGPARPTTGRPSISTTLVRIEPAGQRAAGPRAGADDRRASTSRSAGCCSRPRPATPARAERAGPPPWAR